MLTLKKYCFSLLFVVTSLLAYGQVQEVSKADFVLGDELTFTSTVLDEERKLNIYLPYSYHLDSTKQFPVIYLLDGSADEDFIHIAGLVQFANFPWVNLLPESIVVGIANVDRKRDFTYPTTIKEDLEAFPTTGGSARFITFLENELQPLITSQYRITGHRTIIGQSLGGLLASEVLYRRPSLFDTYIIVSPSLWWDGQSLLKETLDLEEETFLKVYLAVGEEGEIMEGTARALAKQLEGLGERLHFDFIQGQDHANILHQAVYRAFSYLGSTE